MSTAFSDPGDGGHTPSATALEARAAFALHLRERGIRDRNVLRAMESVPRALFVSRRHIDLAARNVALPAACGRTIPEPMLLARMLEGSVLNADMRVLEIDAGPGYSTSVLAHLVREVVATERFEMLVGQARHRLVELGITNATIVRSDGLNNPPEGGFDRVLVHAVLDAPPSGVRAVLRENGAIIYARFKDSPNLRRSGREQLLVRLERKGSALVETVIGSARMQWRPARTDAG